MAKAKLSYHFDHTGSFIVFPLYCPNSKISVSDVIKLCLTWTFFFDWNFNKKLISLNYWSESSFKMACLFRKTLGAEKKSLILKPNQILDDLKQMLFWGLAKTNFEKVVNSLWFIPLIEGQHNRDLVYFFLKEKSK